MNSDMTNEPLDRPLEAEGDPAEEGLNPADFEERVDEDAEDVPNAPNRDPHEAGPANPEEIEEPGSDSADPGNGDSGHL